MKAICVTEFGGPEVLRLAEVPHPRPPQAEEVLIRVRAAGVNPYDTYMRSGSYGARTPALPFTPGSDAAGVVEHAGDGTGLIPGQRVYTSGTITGAYAELALCRQDQVHPLNACVTDAQGAGIFVPYVTAYRALLQITHVRPGETLLVHGGSGAVGVAVVQFARAAGLTVIGTAGSDEGMELVKKEGAHHAVNHRSAEYQKRILEISNGRGVDIIVEMLANVNLANDLTMLSQGGRVVVVGSRGNIEINPRDLMTREAAILGVYLWPMPKADAIEAHAAIQVGLSDGTLRPVVGLELPLSDAAEAHRRVMEPGARGKIVLIP